jgi:hypothetical protein
LVTFLGVPGIGSVRFDAYLSHSALANILFASAGFGDSRSAGVQNQIEKNMSKFFNPQGVF